jgi:outer membrane immunogenic protein
MKKFRLAFVFAASVVAQMAPSSLPASAADLGGGGYKDTPYVVMPWQGLYAGVHGGGVWGSSKVTDQFDYGGDPILNGGADSTGAIAGAQAGFNIQQGHFVFGVEGDIGYLGLSAHGSDTGKGKDYPITGEYTTSGGLYGDITGRVGYATNRVLFYGKGGVAFLDADVKAHYEGENCTYNHISCSSVKNTPSVFNSGSSDTLVGWTIGAGAEYAITPSWSFKAEYQHFDFGSMSYATKDLCTKVPGTIGDCSKGSLYTSNLTKGKTDASVTADAVKFGLNYRINN